MTHVWCNGHWFDPLDFPGSATDRGITVGLGLFETILALEGQPVFADRHLARLRDGCVRLGWHPEWPDLLEIMAELITRNELAGGRARIRLALSAGSGVSHDLSLGADHVMWMTAAPVAQPPESTTANLSPWRRNEHSPLAGLKCASYAENLVALAHAGRKGFEETFFLNTSGHLCEAATSNVFVVKNGEIHTPPLASGCLPGITRAVAIGLAGSLGIPCEERDIPEIDIHDADEIFLTSSIRGVMGVSRFGERSLPAGPVTGRLREAWHEATRKVAV
jgi:branched-subunit amino acid aminotransferase/4-amino-4-deoxychorismate lyase